jgi:hypothetical protein
LDEARSQHTVAQARAIGQLLAKERLNQEEALEADWLVRDLRLERYIEHWYPRHEVVACIARAVQGIHSHRQVYWQNVLKRFEVETQTDGSQTNGEGMFYHSSDVDNGHVQSRHKR